MCYVLVSIYRQLKEGRNSLIAQVLIGVCHMQTRLKKKACRNLKLRARTRNEETSMDKSAFSDSSSHDQYDVRAT